MKKIIATISFIFLITFSIIPVFSFAQSTSAIADPTSGLVPTIDELTTPADTSVVPAGSYTTTTSPSKLDYSGWVQCDGVVDKNEPNRKTKCNFVNLVNMANYLIRWAFMISIPVIVGLLAFAGFKLMTGKESSITDGKKMLMNIGKGFAFMLLAWFIVSTLLNWLVNDSFIKSATTLLGN